MMNTNATNLGHRNQRASRVVAMLAVVVALVASHASANAIRLQANANVSANNVTLGQVATLKGEQASALAELVVARFPDGRDAMTIQLAEVRKQLTEAGVNWGMVSLAGYASCTVKRTKLTATPAADADQAAASNPDDEVTLDSELTLRTRVLAVLHSLAQSDANELRISFADRDQQRLSQNATTHRYEIQPSVSSILGRVPVAIRKYEGRKLLDSFTIVADVKRKTQAMVATRNISRGDTFTPGSVELREVLLGDNRGEPVTDLAQLLGQDADAMLREGSIIYPEHIKSPRLVKRGELITVRCHAGGLIVRTVARATQDGSMGEQIAVRNDSTRETFIVTVTGQREASTGIAPAKESTTQNDTRRAATEAQS